MDSMAGDDSITVDGSDDVIVEPVNASIISSGSGVDDDRPDLI